MEVVIRQNYNEMSKLAAQMVAELLNTKPNAVLGMATGSTPLGLYQELVRMYQRGQLDFSRVLTFNLDEYVGLHGNHPQSYAYFMQENFFEHVNVQPRLKTLSKQTIDDNARFFERREDVPVYAITMGVGTILEARQLLLVASGKSKARAIAQAVEGPVTSMVTASALQLHRDATVITDEDAASELTMRDYYEFIYAAKPAAPKT